jgi:hypothetical protein
MGKAIGIGILWTFIGLFPAALLVGVVYHVPVPFSGPVGAREIFGEGPSMGLLRVWLIIQAVVFYTIAGGFLVVGLLGAIAGVIGWRMDRVRANRFARNIGLGLALIPVAVLSVLDKLIGPW